MVPRSIAQEQVFNEFRMVELKDVAAKAGVMVQVAEAAGGVEHEVGGALAEDVSRDEAPGEARTIRITGAGPGHDLRRHHLGCERKAHSYESSPAVPQGRFRICPRSFRVALMNEGHGFSRAIRHSDA